MTLADIANTVPFNRQGNRLDDGESLTREQALPAAAFLVTGSYTLRWRVSVWSQVGSVISPVRARKDAAVVSSCRPWQRRPAARGASRCGAEDLVGPAGLEPATYGL